MTAGEWLNPPTRNPWKHSQGRGPQAGACFCSTYTYFRSSIRPNRLSPSPSNGEYRPTVHGIRVNGTASLTELARFVWGVCTSSQTTEHTHEYEMVWSFQMAKAAPLLASVKRETQSGSASSPISVPCPSEPARNSGCIKSRQIVNSFQKLM